MVSIISPEIQCTWAWQLFLRQDNGTRLFEYRGDMKNELSQYPKDGIEIINAYVDAINAGIYAMWERKLSAHANNKFVPAELQDLVSIQLSRLIECLQHPDPKFGAVPESGRNEFIRETFEDALNDLTNRFGHQISNWTYEQDPLHNYLSPDLLEKYTLGSLPRGGNSFTVNSTGGSDNQESGASFRIIAGRLDKTLMINSPGQSADPQSKYYDNLFKLWANEGFFPAYFSKEKILFHTDQSTILKPIE
ncbi:MAG: penicillin acylase family protein [Ginsengibacter sp.]